MTAIERDRRCIPALAELEAAYPRKLTVVEGDAMTIEELSGVHRDIEVAEGETLLQTHELTVKFGGLTALDAVTFGIDAPDATWRALDVLTAMQNAAEAH